MKIKRIICFLLSIVLALSITINFPTVNAASSSEIRRQINQLKKERAEIQEQIKEVQAQKAETKDEIAIIISRKKLTKNYNY